MATSQVSEVIQHLRRTVLLRECAGLTDGQLLTDYISRHDEAALAALVRRHGPMVWGVCRRILSDYHDAEDAFQATFLVVVRKAASIASRELFANWLYGVAHQTALKARATVARRKEREMQVAEMPETAKAEQDLWRDLQPLLNDALSRLPDKYRIVIVLCDLEGKTRKEAARQLGCPEGTVAGRLSRARGMLAKRLARRGVVLSGGVLAAVLSQNVASAGVPASVVSSTIKAVTGYLAGQALATGLISAKVAALSEGVMKAMLLTKIKIATVVLLMLAALAGSAALIYQTQAAEEPKAKENQPSDSKDQTDAKGQVTLQWKFEKDKPFYQEMTINTRQDMLFLDANANGVYGHEQTLYFSWRLAGWDKDGNWVLKQKVEAVRFVFRDANGKKTWEYDSRKDSGDQSLLAHYCQQFVGSEFTVTFGKEGKIQRDEERDDLMKRLAKYNPALQTHETQVLSDAALRQSAEILLNPLNPKPIRPGDSWTWNQTLNLRPIGDIECRYRLSYDRSEGKLIRIDVQNTLEGKKLAGKDKELKGKGTGTILFDRDKGRIVSQELELRLKGKIDGVSQGMRLITPRDPAHLTHTDVKLEQRQKITVKTSDTNLSELKGE